MVTGAHRLGSVEYGDSGELNKRVNLRDEIGEFSDATDAAMKLRGKHW